MAAPITSSASRSVSSSTPESARCRNSPPCMIPPSRPLRALRVFAVAFIPTSRSASATRLRDQEQHRHPNRQAVGHLLEDPALGAVGDVAADFDSSVHWAGVHDEDAGLAALEAVPGQAEEAGELSHAGELAALDALELDAEHVNHIDLADDRVEVVDDAGAQLFEAARQQGRRADEDYFGAELGQRPEVGAGDAAVDDVADDRDLESFDPAEALADRVQVEQA